MNETHEKDALTRELLDRSHDVGGHPIGLADVKQSARKIQRRRRVVSGMVAAAVLAVAVPTSIAVTNGMNSTVHPIGPVGQPAATGTPTPRPDGTFVLTTEGLERGEDPQVPYLEGSRLVTPEGTVDFPVTLQQVVPRNDDLWMGLGYDGKGAELFTFDADGDIVDREPTGERFAVSDGGIRLAYVRTQEPWVQELRNIPNTSDYTDEAMGWDLRKYAPVEPVGFLDDRTVVFESSSGEDPFMGLGLPEGEIQPIEGFLNLGATSQAAGLVSGQTTYDPLDGSCSAVMDPRSGQMLWETCDFSLGRFSPNGQFVIGGTPDADGMGSPSLAILDAHTGEPVVEFRPDRDRALAVNQVVWEDNDSVLAIVLDGDRWRMVRASVTGHLEAASDVRPGPDMDIPYWFAEVPRI